MPLPPFGPALRTARQLRAVQLFWRARYTLRRAWWERRASAVDAAYRARAARLPALRWDHPGLPAVAQLRRARRSDAEALQRANDALEGRFTFLLRTLELGRDVAWFRPDLDAGTRLWKTLLHEQGSAEDLARAAAATGDPRYARRLFELLRSWRAAAPIGCRDFALDAWNARAVATRLAHLAVAGSTLGLHGADADAEWLGREIGLHGLFLRDNLELDLRGNHLFRDAAGLVFAHELTGGVPDAWSWLEGQVREQVLPDGAHFERAPMYHALCLQDLVEVAALAGSRRPAWLADAVARMGGWLEAMLLGDGEIPLLGDGWLGEVDAQQLLGAARAQGALQAPAAPERHGGLVPLAVGRLRAVLRGGLHGPDEQLGHAHADLLSFELSAGPRRAISDTGTHGYDPGSERAHLRSTAAHNTLRIGAAEQLETWGSFRVGRRGRARVYARGQSQNWDWVSASHDAYAHLPGRPLHHRLLALCPRGALVVDCVTGSGTQRIESALHEHPQAGAMRIAPLSGVAGRSSAPLHERFGESVPMRRHAQSLEAALPWCGGWWIDCEPAAGEPAPPTIASEGSAVRVELPAAGISLRWRPGADAADTAVSLCSAADEPGR